MRVLLRPPSRNGHATAGGLKRSGKMLSTWQGQSGSRQHPSPEYELMIERIPYPVEGYLFEDQYQDLKIYEGATAFCIEHIPSGDECGMGDGVDQEFYPGMVEG